MTAPPAESFANSWNVYASLVLAPPGGLALAASSGTGGHLVAGSSYYYVVCAVDAPGNEAPSAEFMVSTGSGANTWQATIQWSAVPNALGYKIYRSQPNLSGSEFFIGWAAGSATSFQDVSSAASGAPVPTANTTGMGAEVRQNTSPLPLPPVGGAWPEPSAGLIPGSAGAFVTGIIGWNGATPNKVTLAGSFPYTGTSTGLTATWGIDDTNCFQAALFSSTEMSRGMVFAPSGQYMITRRLNIGDPGTGNPMLQLGIVFFGAGMRIPDYLLGLTAGHNAGTVIVWAGPSNQPMIRLSQAENVHFHDFSIYGPLQQSNSVSLGAPSVGIELQSTGGASFTGVFLVDNVTIGYCGTALLMDFTTSPPSGGVGDVTCNFVIATGCFNYALRNLSDQGLDYYLRSFYVTQNTTQPNLNFVALRFDLGGVLVWHAGNMAGVPTVLQITNGGGNDQDGIFVLDGIHMEQNADGITHVGFQRTFVDTLTSPNQPGYSGVKSTNKIIVINCMETNDGPDTYTGTRHPLFNLGPNTDLTVRSSIFFRNPLASLSSVGSGVTGDTSLVLEDVSYPQEIPFAAAITTVTPNDPGCFWRSRNCRNVQGFAAPGTIRFDESTWMGDGVVAPFRNYLFSRVGAVSGVPGGYFRPGNRLHYLGNEYPYSQLVYATCVGVRRNSDLNYVMGDPNPVPTALMEDNYPAWFDGASYVAMTNGPYAALFNAPAAGSVTYLAIVRIPQSVFNSNLASNPIFSNLNTSIFGTDGGVYLGIDSNVPTFKVYGAPPPSPPSPPPPPTLSTASLGTTIPFDKWCILMGVQDTVSKKIRIYMASPNGYVGPVDASNYVQGIASSAPVCIGQDNSTGSVVNGKAFIEVFAFIGLALTLQDLQNLYTILVNGG